MRRALPASAVVLEVLEAQLRAGGEGLGSILGYGLGETLLRDEDTAISRWTVAANKLEVPNGSWCWPPRNPREYPPIRTMLVSKTLGPSLHCCLQKLVVFGVAANQNGVPPATRRFQSVQLSSVRIKLRWPRSASKSGRCSIQVLSMSQATISMTLRSLASAAAPPEVTVIV